MRYSIFCLFSSHAFLRLLLVLSMPSESSPTPTSSVRTSLAASFLSLSSQKSPYRWFLLLIQRSRRTVVSVCLLMTAFGVASGFRWWTGDQRQSGWIPLLIGSHSITDDYRIADGASTIRGYRLSLMKTSEILLILQKTPTEVTVIAGSAVIAG